MDQYDLDVWHMQRALELAAHGEGLVEPNPMVGCVLARDGVVLGEGCHERFGGPHTVRVAIDKAWTAASFRIPTAQLAAETQAGRPMSGIRSVPRVAAIGGGLPIEAAGSTLGGIGVSGAPGGEADEACARAGLKAIADSLEF